LSAYGLRRSMIRLLLLVFKFYNMKYVRIRFFLRDTYTKRLVLICTVTMLVGLALSGIQNGYKSIRTYLKQSKVSKIAMPDPESQKNLDTLAAIAKLEAGFEFKSIEQLMLTPSEFFIQKDYWAIQASNILAEAGIIDNTDHFWGMKAYKAYNSNLSKHEWASYYKHRAVLTWLLYTCAQNPPESIEAVLLHADSYILEMIASEVILRKWMRDVQHKKVPIRIQKIDCQVEPSKTVQNMHILPAEIQTLKRYRCRVELQLDPDIIQFEQLMKRSVSGLNPNYEAILKSKVQPRIAEPNMTETSIESLYKLKGYYKLSEAADSLHFLIYSLRHKRFFTIGIDECSDAYQICPVSFEPPHPAKEGIMATPARLKLNILDLGAMIELEL
jgi:hypothetical protein